MRTLQKRVAQWAERNFGAGRPAYQRLLGAMEELGELAHAHLKQEQGIRSNEDHDAAARDAIGDVVIYLMDYCSVRGWDFSDCVSEAWGDVSERDWIANPATGTEAPDAT